jgi:phosphate transport system protein
MDFRPHTLKAFDERMEELGQRLLSMGGSVDRQYRLLAQALSASEGGTDEVVTEDRAVDLGECEIDDRVVELLATYSPLASDLRRIISTAKVARELERAGDEARNAAKRLAELQGARIGELDGGLATAASAVAENMHLACVSLVQMDGAKAKTAIAADRAINEQIRGLRTRTVDLATRVQVLLPYIAIGRSIERGGDHAKVIAKLAVGAVTGENPRHAKARAQK